MAEESKQTKRIQSSYWTLSHLCRTSIIGESLFSNAKHIRSNMDPRTLKILLLLKYHKSSWSARVIPPLTGQKRAFTAATDMYSEVASVSELDNSFCFGAFFIILLLFGNS